MKNLIVAAVMAVLLPASSEAALILSGDNNVFASAAPTPGNLQFLYNLAGAGTVVIHPGEFNGIAVDQVTGALDDAGIGYLLLDFDSPVVAADLAGASLYFGLLRSVDWTGAESALLRQFAAGPGHVLLAGDNSAFSAENTFITTLAAAMGTDLAIVDDDLDSGVRHIAQVLTANAFTAGTAGLDYVSTSRVTGGTALYGTEHAGIAFLAYSDVTAVPEPAAWAAMILGFGLAGAAVRRRVVRA